MTDAQLFKFYTSRIKLHLEHGLETTDSDTRNMIDVKAVLKNFEQKENAIQGRYPRFQSLRSLMPEIRRIVSYTNAEIINVLFDGLEDAVRREIAVQCTYAKQTFADMEDVEANEDASLTLLACDNLQIEAVNKNYTAGEINESAKCFTTNVNDYLKTLPDENLETAPLRLLAFANKIDILIEVLTT